MTVFKIFIHGVTDTSNLVFRSDVSTTLTGYGDSILSPKLKRETNKADNFEFIILPTNNFYDSFEKKKTFVYLTRDDKCIFRGRVSDVKTDIFKQRTISCEGDLAFLGDSVQPPNKKNETTQAGSTKKKKHHVSYSTDGGRTYTSDDKDTLKMTPEAYFRKCIDVHNGQMPSSDKKFTVGSVTVTDKGKSEYFERTSCQDTSSVISSDLLSVYGGVLRTRYANGTAYIDWLDAYTEANSQQIKFGVNLIDLDQEPPTDECWSVLFPTGDDNCTVESVNTNANGVGSKYLENQEAINRYGYIVHHHSFNNAKKPEKLLEKAQKYMATHCKIFPNNLIVKAIDLQLIGESSDPLELGDKIRVVSTQHGLDTTMACIAMELDIFNPENNSYTIGTILPPDKEKKKEPISEKQKNSHHSSSRGIANNANAIAGLQNDVNINANNVNVNAENIAINALNIAVNAENIAVVAKNIAIAAETIDIKAQDITVALGEETDDLKGTIELSAAGIKSTFSDNTTGLSSYFSQEAGKIISEVQNTKTGVYTKITQTETSITTEFNNQIYGENGITYDYQRKITETAAGTRDEMYATLYGQDEDGNPIDPDDPNATPLGFYKRVRDESVNQSVDSFHSELYGSGGTATNPKSGSVFDAVYTKTASYSRDYFKAQLYGNGSVDNPDSGTILYGVYSKSAYEWKNELWGSGSAGDPAEGSILYGTKQEIGAKVSKGDVEAGFKITSDGIKLFGKEVSLGKYATVESISGVNGLFTNLVSGTTKATHLKSGTATTDNLYVGIVTPPNNEISYLNCAPHQIKRSVNGSTTKWYSGYILSTMDIDLSHSHSCTTNDDGTITLGGAVAAGSGGSFKIADTKAYKDGVSAATNAVTVDSVILNTTNFEGTGIGTAATSTSPIYYLSSDHTYHVRIRADASNGKHRESRIDFSGDNAYQDGVAAGGEAVIIDSLGRNPDYSDSYNETSHDTRIYLKATATNGATRATNFTVSGASAYNAGSASVTIDSIGRNPDQSDSYNETSHDTRVYIKATASNGATRSTNFVVSGASAYNAVTIDSLGRNPDFSDSYNETSHDTRVYIKATASNGAIRSTNFAVSGASAYNAGSASVTIDSIGRNPDQSDSYNETSHNTRVYIKATASNGATRSTNFAVSGESAYNAGRDAGYSSGYSDGLPNADTWSIPAYSSTKNWQMVAVSDDNDGVNDAVTFKVTFNDNKGASHSHTFTKIPCWDVYNNGKASVTVTSLGRRQKTGGEYYDDAYSASNNTYTLYLTAKASNGSTLNQNVTLIGTEAYNSGYSTGKNDGKIEGQNYVANSISCHTVRVYSDGTARIWVHYNYNGNDTTKTIDIPASGVTDQHS